ncbi:MAG: hypothetical protein QFC55_07040 [Chloroflexota bacterium]|nr:hypothetical protein [Chloroflexota bacterium]
MTFGQSDGWGTSPQALILLVVVAVFGGIVFGLWLFGVMTGT